MEEKPEGTPNPLNPSMEAMPLDANPSEPMEPVEAGEPELAAEELAVEETVTEEPVVEPKPVESPKPVSAPRPTNLARPVDPMIPVNSMGPAPKVGPMLEPTMEPVKPAEPMMQPAEAVETVQTMGVVTDMEGTPLQGASDPMNRPMQKAADELPPKPKKKKTGLIIGMVVSLFLAIGCGVAAALIFMNASKVDPVAVAMNKLISGGAPTNVSIDGTIDIDVNDMSSPFADAKIILKSDAVTKSMINSSEATLNVDLRNGESFSVEFDEVYAANGDLYLKIDGITNALNNPYIFSAPVTDGGNAEVTAEENCIQDESGETNCVSYEEVDCYIEEGCPSSGSEVTTTAETMESLATTLEMLEVIDGEWIRVSTDALSSIFPSGATTSSDANCLTNLVADVSNNSNSIAGMYEKNPFITSTTENLSVTSEKNPIYKVLINSEKFTSFMNEAQNSTVMSNLSSCMGYENSTVNIDNMVADLKNIPELYVEIDGNNDFTRLYFTSEVNGGDASMVVDLNFTYPANVNVPEPVEYKDLATIMQELMPKLYVGQENIEVQGEVVEVQTETTE